jgi:hypothetical protein
MKRLLLATVALAAMMATASAGTIVFTASEDAGPTTTVNTGQDTGAIGPIMFGDFVITNLTGTTNPLLPPPDLLQASQIDIGNSSGGVSHTLHLSVFGTNLTSPTGPVLLESQFDATGITPGWSVLASTDINAVTIDSHTFTTVSGVTLTSPFTLPGSFNVSAHWDITTNGIVGSSNLGTELSAVSVPGPIVGAGLPGVLAAFGMGGWGFWRRRKQVS